jgi:hypothetical protein
MGRYGFEKIMCIGEISAYKASDDLEVMLNAFSFDSGYRYTDRSKGK